MKKYNATPKEVLEIEKDLHNLKMVELGYIRETEKLKHEMRLEFLRIRNAEFKKGLERRMAYKGYKHKG